MIGPTNIALYRKRKMDNKDFLFSTGIIDFKTLVSMGAYDGYSYISKFGSVSGVGTGDVPVDVWEAKTSYVYSTTADIVSLSSSSASDTEPIVVTGLDANGVEVSQEITLTGQTRVALTTPLWRVYRMFNNGTSDLIGTVYCYSGTTAMAGVPSGGSVEKARITDGTNQTLMALYTIPAHKVGFLVEGELGVSLSANPSVTTAFLKAHYRTRRYDQVFRTQKEITVTVSGSSNYKDTRAIADPIPALTDNTVEIEAVSETMGAWASFNIVVIDEARFPDSYLAAIGQPNYS